MIEDTSRIENQKLDAPIDFDNIQSMLDNVCSEIAKHFHLYKGNRKPRKATIIDTLSESTCIACVCQRLAEKPSTNVDALYKECHKLAVNILVERLYSFLSKMGYNVAISTETELDYGKADIIITITRFGVNLKHQADELIIEVKTGNSLSLSQLFRYILSGKGNSIIVWRVRRGQILVFNAEDFKPLLSEFAIMIYLRANRLLSSPQVTCAHKLRKDYYPTQEELQIMLQEFTRNLQETLPLVISVAFQKLGLQNRRAELLDIKQT